MNYLRNLTEDDLATFASYFAPAAAIAALLLEALRASY